MNPLPVITRLRQNAAVFTALVESISPEQAGWKPAPDQWSVVEVVNHLYDEERDDFRQRLQHALLDTDSPWIRIDPKKWAAEKHYRQRELHESLSAFLAERQVSIDWLKGLDSPDWQAIDRYPYGKSLTAEQILVNWLAHDYLHIRQINRLNWHYLSEIAPAVDLRYAGNW